MTENRTRAQNAAIINAALGTTLDTKTNSKPNAPVLQEWADRVGSDPDGVRRDLLAFLLEEELRVELQPSATTEQLVGWLGRLNAGERDAVLAEVKAAAPAPALNPPEPAQEGQEGAAGVQVPEQETEGAQDALQPPEQALLESSAAPVVAPLPPVTVTPAPVLPAPAPAAPLVDLLAGAGVGASVNPDQGLFEAPEAVPGASLLPLPAPVTGADSAPEQLETESTPTEDTPQEPETVRVTVNGRIARYSGTFTDSEQPRHRVISAKRLRTERRRKTVPWQTEACRARKPTLRSPSLHFQAEGWT